MLARELGIVPLLLLALTFVGCHSQCQAGASPASSAAQQMMEVSDSCLVPEPGLYDPDPWSVRDALTREFLFPAQRQGIVLHSVDVGLKHPRLVLLRRSGSGYVLETHELKVDAWEALIDHLRETGVREPGTTLLDIAATARQVQVERHSASSPVDDEIATMLVELWGVALSRVEYAESRADIATAHADGSKHHYWFRGHAGFVHSPTSGSFLSELKGVVDQLARHVNEGASPQDVRSKVRDALQRARRREPCLRPSRDK